MQRFTAVRFNDNRGAELQAGFEIAGDRVGLDDVDHVFDQCPWLYRVRGRTGAELGRFSCFAMEDTVVGGEAVVFDDGACGDNFFAGRPRFADLAYVFVTLQCRVEELAIERRRLPSDGKRTVNLCGIALVTDR